MRRYVVWRNPTAEAIVAWYIDELEHRSIIFWDHAKAFYEEHFGITMPLIGTPQGDRAYHLYVEWAFADTEGKTPEKRAQALKDIEEFVRSL